MKIAEKAVWSLIGCIVFAALLVGLLSLVGCIEEWPTVKVAPDTTIPAPR